MRAQSLTIAIDETGSFAQAKLHASKGAASSGIVAVLSTWEKARLATHLLEIARENGITRLDQLHRMEVARALDEARVAQIKRRMQPAIDAVVGVRGSPAGRIYFHEQEAYGEALLALVESVWEQHREKIKAIDRVDFIVASRKQPELVGYSDRHDYHQQLEALLRYFCRQSGMPSHVRVQTRDAKHDPHLILADFHAFDVTTATWAKDLGEIGSPSNRRAMSVALARTTTIGAVLGDLSAGKVPTVRALDDLGGQSLHEAVVQLLSLARAHVRDRDGRGDMSAATSLLELVWRAADRLPGTALRGQACLLAAEVCSHQGLAEDALESVRWLERTTALGVEEWGTNLWERQARALEHRCQIVQVVHFNVFDFETAFLEFDEERANYEQNATGEESLAHDELYGKILGTLGQACGFLRAQSPELGVDAWEYLERSARCFARSEPIYRSMSLGYRLTDLWDRGALHECTALMTNEGLVGAPKADAYALLHRLRLAAALANLGLEHETPAPLIGRLFELVADQRVRGRTPYDICLKWALALAPQDQSLRGAASTWLDGVDGVQVALLATSLPLLAQLGEFERAARHLDVLLKYRGFRMHWETERAKDLATCIQDNQPPTHSALRGMPWNYS